MVTLGTQGFGKSVRVRAWDGSGWTSSPPSDGGTLGGVPTVNFLPDLERR